MELWYTEKHTDNAHFSIKIEEQLYSGQSEFQRIDVFKTAEFGRILTLDGILMLTEKDEFVYHEMMTHIPMAVNPNIKKVLVIGAGDGGTIREITRYKTVQQIDMVEIDREVVEVSKKFLPFVASAFDDNRLKVYYEDGLKFVRDIKNEYDLIIVDSTDPFGPGEGLFTKEFYGNCYKALTDDGILVNQQESTFYASYINAVKRSHQRIKAFFPISKVYQAHIPTYPSGHWLFGYASKKYDPITDFDADLWDSLKIKTKYYNTELHIGCFALPNNVKAIVYND